MYCPVHLLRLRKGQVTWYYSIDGRLGTQHFFSRVKIEGKTNRHKESASTRGTQ